MYLNIKTKLCIGTALITGIGYSLYSLFGKSKSNNLHKSQLEYEEEGILDIFHFDKKYSHICKSLSNIATPIQGKDLVIPKGLPNYGNTCYFNALLQSLSSCDIFQDYLKHYSKLNSQYASQGQLPYLKSLSKLLSSNNNLMFRIEQRPTN